MCHFVCCCFFFFFQYYYCFVFHCEKVEIVHNFESVSRIQNIDMFFWQPEWHLRMYPFWSLKSVVLSFQWIKWGSSFLYIFVFHQAPMPHPLPWSQQYRLLDLVTKLKSVQWSNLIIYWDGDQPYDRSEGFLTITAIAWHLLPTNNHCNCWTKS